VRVPVDADELSEAQLGIVIARFHELHDQAYSFRQADPVEVVNLHLTGWGRIDRPKLRGSSTGDKKRRSAPRGTRPIVFEGSGELPSAVYDRSTLPTGTVIDGPAVVEEPASTTLVLPKQRLTVDGLGNLIIEEVKR
jgi:N-methylhydantoinase A